MADLRLMAVMLVGCHASADETPAVAVPTPLTAPAGWVTMPAIAEAAATAATAPGIAVAGKAWGEPAMGCYAVWLALRGGDATPAELATQLTGGFGSGAIAVHPGAGPLELAFERPPYHGRVVVAGTAPVTALACFANDREPAACDSACATLIGQLR